MDPLARRECAVEERDAVPEPRDEPRDDLRREDDLRHKDNHALASRERGGGRTQVHLGLAARRDAVKKEAAARAECLGDGTDRDSLRPGRGKIAGAVLVGKHDLEEKAAHSSPARVVKYAA